MYLGDFTTANTVYVYFNTFDSNDPSASVTLTGLAASDILIYKNGSVTERSSTAGFTLLDTDGIDFDGKTGIHGFSIDLSDNTDSGFYAAGGEYTVVVAGVTVDAATVNFVAAQFSIERTGGALALLKGTNSLADIESKIDTLTTNLATVDTVVDGIQTDLSNGTDGLGALKSLIDTVDTVVDGIQTDLSNGTDGLGAIKADTAAILVDTAVIGAAGAGLTAIPWNASWDAEVQSEVADALAVYDPPTKAELDSGLAALNDLDTAGVATAVWNAATATYGSAGSYGLLVETNLDAPVSTVDTVVDSIKVDTAAILIDTADMQPKLGTPAGASISADIAAIEAQTDDIGAAGAGLTAIPWNASWDAEVQSEVADALAAFWTTPATLVDLIWDEPTSGHTTAGTTGLALTSASAPTAAAVADAVWDEALSGHLSAGSTGEALNAAGAAGDPWTTTLPGAYTGSQAGKMLSDIITDTAEIGAAGAGLTALASAANLAIVDTVVDSILVDTAEIGAAGAGLTALASAANLATVDTVVDAIKVDTAAILIDTADMQPKLGAPAGASISADIAAVKVDTAAVLVDTDTTIPASIASLPTATQNADALLNRDMSAVSDTNARSPLNALRLLRNKWNSAAGTLTVRKEDDATTAWTSALTGDAAADPVVGSDPA